MAEYVPETVDVRHAWSLYWYQEISAYKTLDQYEAEFDRWLAQVKADAWQEGFEAGERDVLEHEQTSYDAPCIRNPYREAEDEKEEAEETP